MEDNGLLDIGELIYEWVLSKDHPNFSGHDDLPEAYRVYQSNDITCGIIVYGKFRGRWTANPWNTRTLIRHLLENQWISVKDRLPKRMNNGNLLTRNRDNYSRHRHRRSGLDNDRLL